YSNGSYASRSAQPGMSSARYAARTNVSERRAAEVCSDDAAQLTNLPLERISEVVQPTDAQRTALDELRAASAKAIDMLKAGCPKDLPPTPTGRLAAMETRLQVMLAAVQIVRPALERFYQSLSDEQKARFNAIAPADNHDAATKDRRDLAKLCDEKPGVSELPIDLFGSPAHAGPARHPRRVEGCLHQGGGGIQHQVPNLPRAHAERSRRSEGEPARRNARGSETRAAGAREIFRFAERRAEGAL